VWRCEVSKSRFWDNVKWPVRESMVKILLAIDETELDETRFVFDVRMEGPFDKWYVTVPLFPESRSDAVTAYNGIPSSKFSGTEILTVLDSNDGTESLMSSMSIFTCKLGGKKRNNEYENFSPQLSWTFFSSHNWVQSDIWKNLFSYLIPQLSVSHFDCFQKKKEDKYINKIFLSEGFRIEFNDYLKSIFLA
jgi:hypothetical protein